MQEFQYWYLLKRNENTYPLKTCTKNFIATLFIIDPNWKQHNCPSAGGMDQQIVKNVYNGIGHSNKKEQTIYIHKN